MNDNNIEMCDKCGQLKTSGKECVFCVGIHKMLKQMIEVLPSEYFDLLDQTIKKPKGKDNK